MRSAGAVTAAVSWRSAEDVFLLNQLSRLKNIYHHLSASSLIFVYFGEVPSGLFQSVVVIARLAFGRTYLLLPSLKQGRDDPNFLLHAFFGIVKLACGLILLYLPFRSQVDPNTLVVKVVVIVRIACGPHIYLACILEESERDTIPHTRKE